MAKIKILKPYLDFEVGKTYDIDVPELAKDLIIKGKGKEVANLAGKKDIDNLKQS